MKSFLLKLSVLVFLSAGTLVAFYWKFERNFNDRFYNKFTSHPQSLIAGSSRALLGLDPASIEKNYPAAEPFLNFAFTQKTSPYGEIYFDAIRRKIGKEVKDGLFILEVSPLNVSGYKDVLPEKGMVLDKMCFFNLDPNFEYVGRNSEHPLYFDVLPHKEKAPVQLPHISGWLENMKEQKDSLAREKKNSEQMAEYTAIFDSYRISEYRMLWLEKTISFLREHGRVIILRMPVSPQMRVMETGYCPGFNQLMNDLSKRTGAAYLDMSESGTYIFADLHHMSASSAKRFSQSVGEAISKQEAVTGTGH